MRIAYTTTFDAHEVRNWSGTPYYMARALEQVGMEVDYVGSLKRKLAPFFKAKQLFNQWVHQQRESPRFNCFTAKHYSAQAAKQLEQLNVDAIVSPLINPIAYLDSDKPIILWTDALYAELIGFYPAFTKHSAQSQEEADAITRACLSRCRFAVFCSDWAARSAIELYGMSHDKVKVIPFGANIEAAADPSTLERLITTRAKDKIKLLFLAKSWERKGGDIVLAVVKQLHESGHAVQLDIIGYDHIPGMRSIPSYVRCHGFISKQNEEGRKRLVAILSESHFLFVPSRAEAYGIVFCESNAFAVPCLTTHVGGIGTVIQDEVNGLTFGLDATPSQYCKRIVDIMQDRAQYEAMARRAYQEFCTRLNWQSAALEMQRLIASVVRG